MEQERRAGLVGPASVASAPPLERAGHGRAARPARAVAQAAASLVTRLLLAAGAVVAVGELLRHLAPGPALATLVALTTVSHVVVAVWMAMTGPLRVEELARAGAWGTCVLVLGTLALTSWVLFGQLLAVLAALTLLLLRLDRG